MNGSSFSPHIIWHGIYDTYILTHFDAPIEPPPATSNHKNDIHTYNQINFQRRMKNDDGHMLGACKNMEKFRCSRIFDHIIC